MSDIIIVHGILTHGKSIDKFGALLEKAGFSIRYFEYPIRGALQLYRGKLSDDDGAALANFMRPGDHVVAHSYGGLIWQKSIKAGAKWGKCFVFGAACTSDKMYYPDDSLDEAHIIYNPEDKALLLGSMLPFGHPFGKLGYRGYVGQPGRTEIDRRFFNVRGFKTGLTLNHSHYWGKDAPHWLEYIQGRLCPGIDPSICTQAQPTL